MRLTLRAVLDRLRAEGLATADMEGDVRAALGKSMHEEIPWYLRTLVGIGAWTATGFLLAFLLLIAGLRDEIARMVAGALIVAAAVWVRRETRAEFVKQSAVAASLAGLGLILAGIGELSRSATVVGSTAVVLAVVLARLMPDRVHRFLMAILGAEALIFAMVDTIPYGFDLAVLAIVALTGYVWRAGVRHRSDEVAEMLEPVSYGLVVALFGALLFSATSRLGAQLTREMSLGQSRVAALGPLTTIGITLALIALIWSIDEEHGTSHTSGASFAALTGAAALGAGSLYSPGIVAGVAGLMLAFDRRNSVLLGMAVVFLLVFGSVYYYNLDLTLLEKSGVLAGSGLLLLAIRSRIAR
jgi:uncharacterized protein DUF4401